ncbi:MAG: ABC transporter permease [Terriglobia bacterium]|jgi:ABC-type antimicrobial peptide transport system permease subunit
MNTLLQDLRYGVRMLAKNPGFTAVAVLTLALGIGANTAIFTVINSVLLSTLPVKDPRQLVVLTDPDSHGMNVGNNSGDRELLTYPEFQELRERNQVFSGILAADSNVPKLMVAVEGSEQSSEGAPAYVGMVSGSYFSVLGVNAILGRTFTTEVDKLRDANPVAVISYTFWRSRFGGKPSVLGRRIRIRRASYEIIGVAPPRFFGETVGFAPDIWVPLTMQAEIFPGQDWLSLEKNPIEKTMWLQVMARLKPGVSVAQAKASINVTFQQLLRSQIGSGMSANDRRDFLNQRIALVDGSHGASTLRDEFGKPLLILMGVVGLVLLIACANVANLLLARAASRQKEIAVRVALGAGPARLFRQLLTESVLLAAMGGALGLLLADWADAVLLRLVSRGAAPVPLDIHPDAKILAFTLLLSLLTGILFGLAPAFRVARLDLNSILKGTSRGVVGSVAQGGRVSAGKILVVVQVALSLLLLTVAGLFVHSFRKLAEVKLGYDRDHLLLFRVDPVTAGYKGTAIAQLYRDMLERIRAIQEMNARFDHVGPNYFSTIGIPVLLGRELGPQDEGNGQRVGVINQTMARYYFGDANPIGRRIWDMFPTTHTAFVVVGVVGDAKYNSVRENTPRRFYVPFFNPIGDPASASVEVRAIGNPSAVGSAVREAVKQTAMSLPPIEIHTMTELVGESLTRDRMITALSGFFGALAVLLACVGIYGIMAYAVAGRTNEIGIRMALGAQRGNILWSVLRESLLLVLIGAAIGLPAVIGAAKLITSLLFGLTPADPVALTLAIALMFAVSALASYIPARRAAKVDPMVALRYE